MEEHILCKYNRTKGRVKDNEKKRKGRGKKREWKRKGRGKAKKGKWQKRRGRKKEERKRGKGNEKTRTRLERGKKRGKKKERRRGRANVASCMYALLDKIVYRYRFWGCPSAAQCLGTVFGALCSRKVSLPPQVVYQSFVLGMIGHINLSMYREYLASFFTHVWDIFCVNKGSGIWCFPSSH